MKGIQILTILILGVALTFEPVRSLSAEKPESDTVKIGLLISDAGLQEARMGAEMAVKEANQKQGFNGRKIQLITKSMEGPWGTGAKQTVDLVFSQNVWAIVGSHDGRNAHLAEQVIAKTQVVYVSALAGDPTLSQAYVPWYFSVVPNNIQQAKALVHELYFQKKFKNVVVLSDGEYDGENGLKYFLEEINQDSLKEPAKITYDTSKFDLDELLGKIKKSACEAIVLFGQAHESRLIAHTIRMQGLNTGIYCAFSALGEDPGHAFNPADFQDVTLVDADFWATKKGQSFFDNYKNEYGSLPSATAIYAYDAVNLLLAWIQKSGYNREVFKKEMKNAYFQGATGLIQFDDLGNRIRPATLHKITKNYPNQLDN